jgi:hypothetical protein
MVRFGVWICALASVIWQSDAPATRRVGDIAQQLTESDLATVERMTFASGGRPWLIFGIQRGGGQHFFDAYLSPQTTTAEIRRGSLVRFNWDPGSARGRIVNSNRASNFFYAQVPTPEAGFEVQDKKDLNRPFQLVGAFTDAEILSIVTLLRSRPFVPGGNRYVPDSPIQSIDRDAMDSVTVRLDPATQPEPGNIARIILQRTGGVWLVAQLVTAR